MQDKGPVFLLSSLLACLTSSLLFAQEPKELVAVELSDEEEQIVETVKLGGEDRNSKLSQGVQRAQSYQQIEDKAALDLRKIKLDDAQFAQQIPLPIQLENARDPSVHDPSREAYAITRRNARTMSLALPAPRGLITDRNGEALANSIVAYQPSLRFNQLQDDSDENILKLASELIEAYEALGLTSLIKNEQEIIDHYRHRRWLPLPISPVLRQEQMEELKDKLKDIPYSELLPVYMRHYPAKESSSHILGYTGAQAKLATGPINYNDPIFARQEGRSGLEQSFDSQLQGRDGTWRLMFNEKGEKILDELQSKPKPGGTVVTTLNLDWQLKAEESLRKNTLGRGAFVMLDCQTGEIVVMATVPNFDPNIFIPYITQKDYDSLRDNEDTPLISRAFAGMYPPASTFKPITVASALAHGVIQEDSYIYCPYSVRIGDHEFRNHSGFEGSINCVTALVLSNNPFMYQIAATRDNRLGAERLCATARRFGYGSRAGIPLPDKAGNLPNENWMFRNYGRGFMQGDAANIAIGQGPLLATPLQVAHAIAGIANGRYLPKLQLVRQMLNREGDVVYQFFPEIEENLMDLQSPLAVVRKGMRAVVDGGTGRRAALSFVDNAGKTGTAQWGKASDDCRLAWFAGYLPADNPRYAYVALYEGKPHQRISGGSMAASIVKSFFESIRDSLMAELKKDDFRMKVQAPDGTISDGSRPEAQKDSLSAEQKAAKIQEEQKRAEFIKRNSTQGWDDGRSRR